jgi:lipopolysaccharide biosynthesis regulator YciM
VLSFLECEIGHQALRAGDRAGAAAHYQRAIDLAPRTVPAYLALGDIRLAEGRPEEAIALWQRAVEVAPERAYLAFDRLRSAHAASGAPERFAALCQRLIAANPTDWRARLALARDRAACGAHRDAFEGLLDALPHNPHALTIHQAVWSSLRALGLDPSLVQRYTKRAGEAVFYLDPHVCLRCRYRSTELLWQCPHCREWGTFVEERLTGAQELNEPG